MTNLRKNSRHATTVATKDMLIGALLRVPAEAIHRRIIRELNAAGFGDLSLPHMAIFRFPGPDGARPVVLAQRAGMSKQAMNRLLGSLEELGYLKRSDAPGESRARIVRLTRRGHAVYARAIDILEEIEHEWNAELGREDFVRLKQLLFRVWESPLVR
ncbi:MAG TPA: MarR family transcriptional regulator [Terracidiphilus sp.]|nr:MarR family transcriptional regulator [Terracidiphilus sp.]